MELTSCGIIGAIVLFLCIRLFIPLLLVVYRYLTADWSYSHVKSFRTGTEDWAVVTGGTDGIGRAYATELAKLGFNVCIISRSMEKLKAVTTEIGENFGVKTRLIQADFTKETDIYDHIREEMKTMDVAILVNNVGMTQQYPCLLNEHPSEDSFYVDFVHCNMTSATVMSRLALREGGMLERKRGLIINISSASALLPIPLAIVYCGTKRYLDFLSRALERELHGSGIEVQTVLPFYVLTKFIGRFRPPGLLAPTPETYVRSALAMVGVESRTHGCLSHAIQGVMTNLPPEFLRDRVSYYLHSKRAKIVRGN